MEMQRKDRNIPWFLIAVFILLVAGILTTGFLFYQKQHTHLKFDVQENLNAIADLKAEQIAHWQRERLGNGELIRDNASFVRQVVEYFKTPDKTGPKQDIFRVMKSFEDNLDYESVLLLDTKGIVRLTTSIHGHSIAQYEQILFKDAILKRKIVLSDLHRSETSPFVRLDLIVPLFLQDRNDSTFIGMLILCIDPNHDFFPLVQAWPTQNHTSETLLLRRDGDEVVYLNELRHQKNTTLALRIPISNEQLPASMAARGIEGIVEGKDYRNVPVLAAIRQIYDSPWYMVAKVDQEEIYAPLQSQAWIVGIAIFLLILAAGTIIVFWWQRQRARFYREQYEAQKENEERYRQVFELSPDTIFIQSEGNITFINEAGVRLFGASSKEELIGRRVVDLVHPDYREIVAQRINQLQSLQQSVPIIEKKYLRLDGSSIDVEVVASPFMYNEKPSAQVVVRDITECKHAEEALQKSEGLFKTLVESSPVAIAVFFGEEQTIEYVSHRFTELFGYEQTDLPAMDAWWALAYPIEEYRNQIETAWSESIRWAQRANREPEPIESVISCKDGSAKYIESTFTSVGDHTLVFFSDLTQRRMAEEALRQTHAFNDLLIQTMPFGMNIVDEDGNILFVSKAMKEMLVVDVVDMCCWMVYKDNNQQCIDCPLRRGITFGKPDVLVTNDVLGGKTFQISYVGIMYEGRKAMLEVFQDITEQKKLQNELLQSQKLLSIGTMAGGIAHDFNNILGIILGYSSILPAIKDNPQRFSDGVNAIKQTVDRGANLVRQILTFARKTDVLFEPLSVSELVKELISMLQQTFPKIITFKTSMEKHLPYVNADHTQIHQALLNLCVNARDAMPNGGEISIKSKVITGEKLKDQFSAADQNKYICLSVSDTGIGIDEATRSQIFDPFFTTKEKGKGTGLGLSVVFGIVQTHHGFINFGSTVGSGTTFRLYLPVPQESNSVSETQIQVTSKALGGTETILLVEDEELLLNMMQILLETYGYNVLIAKDGQEAVEIYAKHTQEIALVITDIGLPRLSGIDELYKLKEINPDVKLIFASGYFEHDAKIKLTSAGAKGFLQKPYVVEEVLMKIREALR